MLQLITFYNLLLPTLLILVFSCYLSAAASIPTTNITIEVPVGTTNHGDPHLLCTPTQWTDLVMFYLGNFFFHAATVKPYPGEATIDLIVNVVSAILFPTIGVIRGLNSIVRCSIFTAKGGLQRTARSGALCMVVRSRDWKPKTRNIIGSMVTSECLSNEYSSMLLIGTQQSPRIRPSLEEIRTPLSKNPRTTIMQ